MNQARRRSVYYVHRYTIYTYIAYLVYLHVHTDESAQVHCNAVLPNLFSTAAHFLGTAHQTAHCIYGTYFIYNTYLHVLCRICRPTLYIYTY